MEKNDKVGILLTENLAGLFQHFEKIGIIPVYVNVYYADENKNVGQETKQIIEQGIPMLQFPSGLISPTEKPWSDNSSSLIKYIKNNHPNTKITLCNVTGFETKQPLEIAIHVCDIISKVFETLGSDQAAIIAKRLFFVLSGDNAIANMSNIGNLNFHIGNHQDYNWCHTGAHVKAMHNYKFSK